MTPLRKQMLEAMQLRVFLSRLGKTMYMLGISEIGVNIYAKTQIAKTNVLMGLFWLFQHGEIDQFCMLKLQSVNHGLR